MNHWNLFKESWRIFWRHPALWLFGLLAALGGGFNLRYTFNFNFNPTEGFDPNLFFRYFNLYGQRLGAMPPELRTLFDQIFNSQVFGALVIIGIVWAILAFLLVTYADGALMGMVNAIGDGQPASLGFGFRVAARRYLPLLAVRFLLALPALLLALVVAIVTSQIFLSPAEGFGPAQFFGRTFTAISGLGALGFIVGLLMMAIGISAERAVVLDELPIWPSIVKGWKLLWGKFGDYFTIVLLMIGLAILVGIVLACVLTPILCGTLGLGAASSFGAFQQNGANILAGLFVFLGPFVLIAVLLGLLLSMLVNVFTSGVWTLAYREWNKPAAAALQPVAPSIEPIPPIESSTAGGPPANEPPPAGGL
jgi:hypothetical protein